MTEEEKNTLKDDIGWLNEKIMDITARQDLLIEEITEIIEIFKRLILYLSIFIIGIGLFLISKSFYEFFK